MPDASRLEPGGCHHCCCYFSEAIVTSRDDWRSRLYCCPIPSSALRSLSSYCTLARILASGRAVRCLSGVDRTDGLLIYGAHVRGRPGCGWTRSFFLALIGGMVLGGCDNGRLGELQTKPIYAELSSAYYGGMCEGEASPSASTESVRALRIGMITGDCAVLYLDGVDRAGELVIYGAKTGARPECSELVRKLEVERGSSAVLARAREICK
ncbi:hypothetical protein SAMN05518671_1828 [Stenotrophomonas lactitubi]|nr:hypothetical protein SAMN04487863_2360 [Stenotrophomonas sp. yr243]SNS75248.1 hypothetical protein SAMN05518671_1828 [Stenotrophomonas lactitubi]